MPESVLQHFVTNDFLKELHARQLVQLLLSNIFQDWFTEEDAMLEIIEKAPDKP